MENIIYFYLSCSPAPCPPAPAPSLHQSSVLGNVPLSGMVIEKLGLKPRRSKTAFVKQYSKVDDRESDEETGLTSYFAISKFLSVNGVKVNPHSKDNKTIKYVPWDTRKLTLGE